MAIFRMKARDRIKPVRWPGKATCFTKIQAIIHVIHFIRAVMSESEGV